MRGGNAFTLVLSWCDGDAASGVIAYIDVFTLLWVQAVGPSVVDMATEVMRMLTGVGLFGTSTNWHRQSPALSFAPDIYFKVMLSVANPSDHQFAIKKLLQGFVIIVYNNVRSL